MQYGRLDRDFARNREVIGWSIKPRMKADIVTDVLTMARGRRICSAC
jgi:transposase InsO family protein